MSFLHHLLGRSLTKTLLTAGILTATAISTTADKPNWIWGSGKAKENETVYFRKIIRLNKPVQSAKLTMSCDNGFEAFINGKKVLAGGDWNAARTANVKKHLKVGRNIIAVRGWNDGSVAGLVGQLDIASNTSRHKLINTDDSWRTSRSKADGWESLGFDARNWTAPLVTGTLGDGPWGNVFAQAGKGSGSVPGVLNPDQLQLAKGFKAELLHVVPKGEQGSWVAMTEDHKGRLIASDQYGHLYRITPPKIGEDVSKIYIEKINAPIGHAQGLLWAFNSLYVVVNGGGIAGHGSGLYRVIDTDGDDQLDKVETLKKLKGGGEHGPHDVILTPDGKNLFVIAGNHTLVPDLKTRRNPSAFEEDLLLPRQPDARGHARNIRAPGGWICQVTPDGKNWDLISSGYRNPYGLALNHHGELFTYDADMEWDYGTPWYRPTRVNHVVSGSEYGWRTGTGKWPAHYPDSLPPAIDIGPGCPTGTKFGTGANFPKRYQEALYILDWTFGTIYAIHMTPDGASYTGTRETFVAGKPLPVTDLVFHSDGAMYFAIGGRRSQSALYRVTWNGNVGEETALTPAEQEAAELRILRKELEAFHGRQDSTAVQKAFKHLGHKDRFIRYAARLAIENQPLNEWESKWLNATNPDTVITGAVALARSGQPAKRDPLLNKLLSLPLSKLSERQQLELSRAYALAFIRMGEPGDSDLAKRLVSSLDNVYPSKNADLNREISQLLVFLKAPSVIGKTLALMDTKVDSQMVVDREALNRNDGYGGTIKKVLSNTPEIQNLHYAMTLRNLRYGWRTDQRKKYFHWFKDAATKSGGVSYGGFLKNFQKDALANAPASERPALEQLVGDASLAYKPAKPPTPKGPGQLWELEATAKLIDNSMKGRNFENGRRSFAAALCASCHRFDGQGGATGPDLTSSSARFSTRDLLDSIIHPNKVVSDQYAASIVTKVNGDVVNGRVLYEENGALHISINPLDPDQVTVIKQLDVKSVNPSPISPMPPALINILNRDELLDLFAYIKSGGNRSHTVFSN
ncbi:MAG: c-type cytochrome [Verrucomicrobiota bacterium]|nr:c-type cytochrome [Verrucomicrobiota bacterium]